MVFTLGTMFEAALLVVNAIAILNEERFLKKGGQTTLHLIVSISMCLFLLFPQVGWGRDYRNEGFGDQAGMKSQLIALITAVQTLLRSMRQGKSIINMYCVCGYFSECQLPKYHIPKSQLLKMSTPKIPISITVLELAFR